MPCPSVPKSCGVQGWGLVLGVGSGFAREGGREGERERGKEGERSRGREKAGLGSRDAPPGEGAPGCRVQCSVCSVHGFRCRFGDPYGGLRGLRYLTMLRVTGLNLYHIQPLSEFVRQVAFP